MQRFKPGPRSANIDFPGVLMIRLRPVASAACAALALALASCSSEAPPAPPPPEVNIVTVGTQAVPNVIELPGRVQAYRTAEVRARVDGIVERRLFEEGSYVAAGKEIGRASCRERVCQYV